MSDIDTPYTSYSRYLRKTYGTKVYRVSVDGGFSCPHRGVDRRMPGCSFCDERGSLAAYQPEKNPAREIEKRCDALADQIENGISFLKRRYNAKGFLLYFQAYTCTNAPPAELKQIYDFGVAAYPFLGLIVSTRPDCINPEIIRLIASYKTPRFDVWVELGLQSANDDTLQRIRRGHNLRQFVTAFKSLRKAGIKVAVHVIFLSLIHI